MTIAERIAETVAAMPITRQRQALALVRKLRPKKKSTVKQRPPAADDTYIPKDPALRNRRHVERPH